MDKFKLHNLLNDINNYTCGLIYPVIVKKMMTTLTIPITGIIIIVIVIINIINIIITIIIARILSNKINLTYKSKHRKEPCNG